nr:hypothetical protein [Marinicella sp. W31]MDC2877021.1 hypothetical protein [Marinicella sp. W31]
MINAAKQTLESERETVVSATQSIDLAIRSFKDLAAAYDGQLEKAFDTQASAVERVIAELEAHTKGIHERFAEALSTLKGVIENAKSFEPESAPPSNENAGQ